jgi:F0F1-type ATP synthase alpha subunit
MSDEIIKPVTDIRTTVVQKLLGQEMNTIMLVALLAAFSYALWWGMTTGVPAHLKEIKNGYMEVTVENGKRLSEAILEHGRQQQELQKTFEKTLDRIERRVDSRVGSPAAVKDSE